MKLEIRVAGNYVYIGEIDIRFDSEELAQDFARKFVKEWLLDA